MHWREVAPDRQIVPIADVVRDWSSTAVVECFAQVLEGARLLVAREVLENVMTHGRSDLREIGGLLTGEVWELPDCFEGPERLITVVRDAVPSQEFDNSTVSVRMAGRVWTDAGKRTIGPQVIVGWYHSHPNLGVFFSGTDRRTQRAFFANGYSVGLVVDPYRNESKWFRGGEARECGCEEVVFTHGLAHPKVD